MKQHNILYDLWYRFSFGMVSHIGWVLSPRIVIKRRKQMKSKLFASEAAMNSTKSNYDRICFVIVITIISIFTQTKGSNGNVKF